MAKPLISTLLVVAALVAVSCGAAATPSPPVSPSASALSSATASPVFTTRMHGPEIEISAPCMAGYPVVTATALFWIGCELTATSGVPAFARGTAQIYEYDVQSARTRLVYQSSLKSGGISQLRISDDWLVWAEYADLQKAADTRIYAMRRTGGDRILLEDASRQTLGNLIETALDGARAYWTVPMIESGVWHGRLMQRTLPDGPSTIAITAPSGSVITWPSVRQGAIAYERSSQSGVPQTRVVLRLADGTERDIGTAPNSEPSLGDGFVAYKQSERFTQGDLNAFVLSNGTVVPLGPGEAPDAKGTLVTWMASAPLNTGIRLAAPLKGCVDKLSDLQASVAFPALGPTSLAWMRVDGAAPPGPAGNTRIHYFSTRPFTDSGCNN